MLADLKPTNGSQCEGRGRATCQRGRCSDAQVDGASAAATYRGEGDQAEREGTVRRAHGACCAASTAPDASVRVCGVVEGGVLREHDGRGGAKDRHVNTRLDGVVALDVQHAGEVAVRRRGEAHHEGVCVVRVRAHVGLVKGERRVACDGDDPGEQELAEVVDVEVALRDLALFDGSEV